MEGPAETRGPFQLANDLSFVPCRTWKSVAVTQIHVFRTCALPRSMPVLA